MAWFLAPHIRPQEGHRPFNADTMKTDDATMLCMPILPVLAFYRMKKYRNIRFSQQDLKIYSGLVLAPNIGSQVGHSMHVGWKPMVLLCFSCELYPY